MSIDSTPIERLQVVSVEPGDKILCRLSDNISMEAMQELKRLLEGRFPEHDVLVYGPNIDLQVMRASGEKPAQVGDHA